MLLLFQDSYMASVIALIILFNINHLFINCEVVTSIAMYHYQFN